MQGLRLGLNNGEEPIQSLFFAPPPRERTLWRLPVPPAGGYALAEVFTLVVMSPAGPEHRKVSRPFRRELRGYWQHPDVIEDVDVAGWGAMGPDEDRMPDICVYLVGSSDTDIPNRVPDMIFEFVSGSRADQECDYIHKRAEYYAIGVKEYVIVDRFKHIVLVLTWQETDYAERALRPGDTYTTPMLPGLEVSIRDVFD